MEIVIWLLVVLLAAVPAGLLTTFAVVWHERRRLPEPVQRPPHGGNHTALCFLTAWQDCRHGIAAFARGLCKRLDDRP